MNSVSRLNEIAQQSRSPYPTYEFSSDEKTFWVTCKYQDKYVTGSSSKNRRLAKLEAARMMLSSLSNVMIVEFDPSPLWEGAQEVSLLLKKDGLEKIFLLKV
jgi:hypothetical protein